MCVCEDNYFDGDEDISNGCERSLYDTCEPGTTQSCYPYAAETKDVGTCQTGIQRCLTDRYGHYWSLCEGAIGPREALTCTEADYNCNGIPDGQEDRDGDGYSICAGDCCDTAEQCGTSTPELIHPGMYEIAGDGFDNNCNGIIDETEATLEPIAYEYGRSDMQTAARALTRAMDINQECESAEKCAYGLYEVSLTHAGSTHTPDSRQVNVMFGMKDAAGVNRVLPQKNGSFAVLSSGIALDVYGGNAKDANFFNDLEGHNFSSDFRHEAQVGDDMTAADGEVYRVSQYSRVPDVYRTAHGGKLQMHKSCPTGNQEPAIFDSVQLHLGLKAPVNAKGFSFDFRFFSREYPAYLCSKFNDFFLVLSSSKHEEMSKYPDRNIAFDEHKNPVSVNNGFFTSCDKPMCGSASCPAFMTCSADQFCTFGDNTCRDGAAAISAYYPEYYSHAFHTEGKGGGTAWLHTTAPVIPGESFSLDFYIWDTGDNRYDSTVLLDNFKWELDDVKVGTDFAVVN